MENEVITSAVCPSCGAPLKEADETAYWLELLFESGIIDKIEYDSLNNNLKEIIAMLTSTIKTMKNKIKQ